ncbi:MAG: type I secretion system ATPase [Rhodospirillales bacterium RIFCSPLOWO2_12_FULL_58_28]|nr:MAG: type I secretion system ATPase [Rhodospirillales bacterium RIFCSPLOWO2_02_FULL_58_16]OHC78406.1 MAG: type I secretion system ATPase [Rhodospirillales bacterium RIFCSPLOWO2_12_FULL_58_28]
MKEPSTRSWIRPFIDPLVPIFREVIAMSAFVNILALAVPIFVLQVYDRVIGSGGISTLYGLIIGMIIVLVFDYVLRMSRSRIMQTVALRIDVQVGRKLFNKIMSLPLQTLESRPGSHWNALFRDVDVVRNTLSGASAVLIADLPFAIMFLGVIFVIAAPVAWVLLIILPMFIAVAWRSGAVLSAANKDERGSSVSRDAMVTEMISGRTTIKALALDTAMRPIWEDKHAENIERSVMRGSKADGYSNLGASLTMMTSICLTTIGALAIVDQRLTMGSLIATNMLSGRLLGPINQLVGQWRAYAGFLQAVERLGDIFKAKSERQESEIQLERPKGNIVIENVSFTYSEDLPPVINGVDLAVKPHSITALVGRNGCGKTTLLKILQGLYKPTDGRVVLDGADISQFSRPELARWIGYVPQETILFSGTIHDNLTHRFPDADDADIIRASKEAGAHSFIIDMPDGYASGVGEAGQRLSGGQRQRIAIARALMGDPPVLLFDEPSSSLDRQAEQELRKTLAEISKTRTIVIVTHSPILLAACHELVALDKGKIALSGPAEDILPRLFGTAPKGKAAPPPAGKPTPPPPPPTGRPASPPAVQVTARPKPVVHATPHAQPLAKITPKKIEAGKPVSK